MTDPTDPRLPDLRYVRELAKVFKQFELDVVEIETGDVRVLLRRSDAPVAGPPLLMAPAPAAPAVAAPAAPTAAPAAPAPAPPKVTGGEFITSPFVGTFYRSPRPDSPPFVDVGATVAQGQTLCIVEAMKLFNELEADYACVIEECLVETGQPVEFGAKLFRVRKL
jgi:acetyl-CoA carboxylase biotin carboxyl carrier protein